MFLTINFLLSVCCEKESLPSDLTPVELESLENAAVGIRLAARIVDTPCNEMNVDHFLEVRSRILTYFFLQTVNKLIIDVNLAQISFHSLCWTIKCDNWF